ncbi:hypothetical protein Bca4012_010159 [Brassica carinata]
MPTSSSSSGDHLFVCYSSSGSSSDTSSDPSSYALNPKPFDAVYVQSSSTSLGCVANVISSGPDSCPVSPPIGYTAIFIEVRGIGFHQNLYLIMVELCGLLRIAPSQLTLRFWGLIHALRSPVELPEWLDSTPTSSEYFFVLHVGPRPNGLRLSWLPSGVSTEDPGESTAFPVDLLNLASNLRDRAFLLHPEIIQLSSLASTDDHLFVPARN